MMTQRGAGVLRRLKRAAGRIVARGTAARAARNDDASAPGSLLHRAIQEFSYKNYPNPKPDALDAVCLRKLNANLQRFAATTGLRPRFELGTFDRETLGAPSTRETCIADMTDNTVRLRFPSGVNSSWLPLHRILSVIPVMDTMLRADGIRDGRFRIDLGDICYHTGAGFSSALADACLLPDPDFIATGGYENARQLIRAGQTPWRQRSTTIFWRGTTTGRRRAAPPEDGAADDFTWLPRLEMCRRARDSALAAYYDVGISKIVQIDEPELQARIAAAGLCRPSVRREGFLGHKAILAIDGNSNAWSALFVAFLTGACVFKVDSERGFKQWYYDSLIPWVHYVPVSSDLTDLDDRLAWLLGHDTEAEAIGQAGRHFAEAMTFETERDAAAQRLRHWLPVGQLN